METYLHLSSKDSLLYYPNNEAGSFIVVLPKTFHLDEKWECALLELSLPQPVPTNYLFVCADFIEDSYVRNQFFPVLRGIPGGTKSESLHLTFEHPYYLRVRQRELTQFQITIRDGDLNPLNFGSKPLQCVLALRRKE